LSSRSVTAGQTGDARPRALIVLREPRVGGAERLVLEGLPHVREEFEARLAVLTLPDAGAAELRGETAQDARTALFGRADVIHTHLSLPGALALLRRTFDGSFRWVHSAHYHSEAGVTWGVLRRWIDRRVYAAADALIAVSSAVSDSIGPNARCVLLENAIDLSPVDTLPAEDRPSLIGTVAMLRREKGLEDLIRATRLMRDRGVDVTVHIAGDGPIRASLEALIDSLGLGDRVRLLGYVTDLGTFYSGIAVYVQSSVSEPFGLALLEALRYERPVVATEAGYLPTLLGEGAFGTLVPRDENVAERLADALTAALDSRKRLAAGAREGRAYWAARLDVPRRARAVASLYKDVLQPRLCYVAPIATHGGGGLQRQVELQTRALAEAGHRVYLVQRRDPRLGTDPEHADRWSHVDIVQTPGSDDSRGGLAERVQGAFFVASALLHLIRIRRQFDVIVAQQLYSPTFVGALAARLLGKKLVVRVTASGELGEAKELERLPFKRLRRWAFRRIDRVMVLTEKMAREVASLGLNTDRVVVLPNSVEVPDDWNAPGDDPQPNDPQHDLRLLYTGRLSSEKSIETLLDAVATLAERGTPSITRIVGGSGGVRDVTDELTRRARELPRGAVVEFTGRLLGVSTEYRSAQVFILPSVSEGMSNSLLEAMAYGLVCVASDIPENRALIRHGENGLLFEQGRADALSTSLSRIREDLDDGGHMCSALGSAARATIERQFSAAAIAERLSSLFEEVSRDSP
jgi:L-malate glycosyltransferase